jgi:S-methylmethionine-dependent homocysteine/selenocysteine methylase
MFVTGGGLETTMIFRLGIELPLFASFELLNTDDGQRALRSYHEPFLELARRHRIGAIVDTPTWRANREWAERLGYSPDELDAVIRRSVQFARALEADYEHEATPIAVSACLGPRGDGYHPHGLMSAEESEAYHSQEIATFAAAGVDLMSAWTLSYAAEAVGLVRAAMAAGVPISISFTVETDGRLPSGQPLGEAIEQVDAETASGAAYFMVNCAYPTHIRGALEAGGAWRERIHGVRPNASKKSHAELDESAELDDGDPLEWAADFLSLRPFLPALAVVGGCCGTDHRHVGEACALLLAGRAPA